MSKIETIKEVVFHIKGMQEASERSGIGGNPNYVRACLVYKSGKGYFWDIRPVYKYMLDGVEMMATVYGLSVAEPRLEEVIVECGRKSPKKEQEAREYFESNVASAISNRLRYRIELAA